MRGLFFEWSDDPEIWDYPYEYMLGDDILVAPVVWANCATPEIYVPQGSWLDPWRGAQVDGPTRLQTKAPLDEIPVLLRVDASQLTRLFD